MAYRGDDLDLRTPQGWSSSGREGSAEPNWWTRTAVYKGGQTDPIWVDDNVMACCNHAFDLAIAHRSPEVRLEHLINALTLSDAASQVLEARGLGVASLRRESGTAIANDFPAVSGSGQLVPKRSEALIEVLRQAADQAYPRRAPVGADDLLHVIFGMKRDIPGVQLLHRHTAAWSNRNGAPDIRLDARGSSYAARPRYASTQAHDYFSQPTREPVLREPVLREPVPREQLLRERDIAREPILREPILREPPPREPPPREYVPQTPTDSFQDTRIDSLERAVRDLGIDLADDRKTIRSLVTDLQRTAAVQADDTGRFRGSLSDRLGALEDSLLRSRSEPSQLPVALMDRIGGIERNIEARLSDLARQPAVSQALVDHITMVERSIDARLAEIARAPSVPQNLIDRLGGIERALEARLTDIGRAQSAIADRLHSLENTQQRPSEATLSPLVTQRLDSITTFATKLDNVERTFQLILDRLTGVERKLASATETKSFDLSPLDLRLASIEHSISSGSSIATDISPVTDLLSGIESRVAGLERSLDNRSAETTRTVTFIGERLRTFEEAIGGQKTQTTDRLAQLERALSAYAENTVSNGSTRGDELTEVTEALLKLNANQQTLAASLDQWRLDSTGDLSVIGNRLKSIEETEFQQNPLVDDLAAQVQAIHRTVARREARRSRFRHWLFGTDEWYSSSYDTERWRARQADSVVPSRTAESVAVQQRPTPPSPPPSMLRR